MEQLRLKIGGMSCQHCVSAVEASLKKLSGIKKVKVDLAKNQALIKYDDSVNQEQIEEQILEAGYEVEGEVGV